MVGRKVLLRVDKAPPQPRRGACSRPSISAWSTRRGVRAARRRRASSCAPARSSASPASRATARPSCWRCWPASARRSAARSRSAAAMIDADHPGDPAEMRDLGLAHVPEDRHAPGPGRGLPRLRDVDPGLSRASRRSAGNFLLDRPAVGAHCAELMERFDVRPRAPGLRSSSFSGGNQQKLVLAREMAHEPERAAGRPADARRRYRRHRVHPRELVEMPRRRLRRAAGLGRARRDPVARRPHPGDVRRPDRRRGRRPAAPTSARSA